MYLSHSELEHASGILSDLLRLLLGEVQAPLHLSRVEGDAVISYAPPGDGFQGQLVVDRIDDAYVAFRRALEQMVRNTTCQCNACANISGLDLKFVVHHGEFLVQRIGTQDELLGPDVNLMFRLTKNKVRERLGLPGYVAFTPEALAAVGLPGFEATLLDHVEEDPERGSVTLKVRDMAPLWEERKNRGAVVIPPDEVVVTRERVVPGTPEVVFAALGRPETRAVLFEADGMEVDPTADGRIGVDAVYVCAHGDKRVPHRVIDWAPPTRYAFTSPLPGGISMVCAVALTPDPGGTRVTVTVGMPKGFKSRLARPMVRKEMGEWFDALFPMLERMMREGVGTAG